MYVKFFRTLKDFIKWQDEVNVEIQNMVVYEETLIVVYNEKVIW